MSINENARSLMLSYISNNYELHAKEATETAMPYLEFLDDLLFREVEYRRENRLKKRIIGGRFPYKKYLVDFDTSPFDKKTAKVLRSFFSLDFIKNNENIILIGNPGVGNYRKKNVIERKEDKSITIHKASHISFDNKNKNH